MTHTSSFGTWPESFLKWCKKEELTRCRMAGRAFLNETHVPVARVAGGGSVKVEFRLKVAAESESACEALTFPKAVIRRATSEIEMISENRAQWPRDASSPVPARRDSRGAFPGN
jgi:hypothetical protein